jgi:hypothetical protein
MDGIRNSGMGLRYCTFWIYLRGLKWLCGMYLFLTLDRSSYPSTVSLIRMTLVKKAELNADGSVRNGSHGAAKWPLMQRRHRKDNLSRR